MVVTNFRAAIIPVPEYIVHTKTIKSQAKLLEINEMCFQIVNLRFTLGHRTSSNYDKQL